MTPAAVRLRPFEPSDLDTLQAIRTAAFAPVFASFRAILGAEIARVAVPDAEAEQVALLAEVCAPGAPHQVLVATMAGVVVGFVSFRTDPIRRSGEIGLNAVDPAYARRGIGTALYAAALGRMKEAGMAVATVATGGEASHAAARRPYAKAGFGPGIPCV
jgi:ribosomal protein S18 acetylase RimI-like enzyme